jgi:hypothetical protein
VGDHAKNLAEYADELADFKKISPQQGCEKELKDHFYSGGHNCEAS